MFGDFGPMSEGRVRLNFDLIKYMLKTEVLLYRNVGINN